MKTIKITLVTLVLALTQTLTANTKKITVDLSKLDFGSVPRENVYLMAVGIQNVGNDTIYKVEVENLPSIIAIRVRDKWKFTVVKLIWAESDYIKISGSLNSTATLRLEPESAEQDIANRLLNDVSEQEEVKGELALTKPYMAYLSHLKYYMDIEHIKEVVSKCPKSMKGFWAVENLQNYLSDIENVGYSKGEKYFRGITAQDKEKIIVSYKQSPQKFVLLDFASSFCTPCISDIEKLANYDTLYSEKLDIVSVWNDQKFDLWINTAKEQKEKITWTSLFDRNGAIHKAFDIKILPTYYLFDTQGKLVKKWYGSLPDDFVIYL